ncbi:MAG: hypothetical protein NTY38_33640 [Acidobacteria bacterium]|nr:hypothetical protein [Acidobacteriota bacterium]
MQAKVWVLCACLSGGVLLGQTEQTPAPSSPSSDSSSSPAKKKAAFKEEDYVRRFSIGATVSIMGLAAIRKDSTTASTTPTSATTVDNSWNTTGKSQRIGYGLTGQVAITDHFAVSVSGIIRKIGYTMDTTSTTTTIKGLSYTINSVSSHEDTRARLFDFPATLRYYNKNRHDPGPRVFIELGGALRKVNHITTSISNTANDGTLTCCTVTPARPAHSTVRGAVGGFGVHLIDPVGIRVIPEIRYTRWMNDTFHSNSTRMQRNQIEAILSLSF